MKTLKNGKEAYPLPIAWDEIDDHHWSSEPIAYYIGKIYVNAADITIGDGFNPIQLNILTPDGDGIYGVYAVKHPTVGVGLFISLEIE